MTEEAMIERGKSLLIILTNSVDQDPDPLTEVWAEETEVHLVAETIDMVEGHTTEMVVTETTVITEGKETSLAIEEEVRMRITLQATELTATEAMCQQAVNSCSTIEALQEVMAASEEVHPETEMEASDIATRRRTESEEKDFASSARTRVTWPRTVLQTQVRIGEDLIDLVMVDIREGPTTMTETDG